MNTMLASGHVMHQNRHHSMRFLMQNP